MDPRVSTPSPPSGRELLDRIATLTSREHEVLDLILKGMSNDQVALALFRSPKTVDKHCQRIYRKLGVHRRVKLVRLCMEAGYKADQGRRTAAPIRQSVPAMGMDQDPYLVINDLVKKSRAWDRLIEIERLLQEISGPSFFGELVCALSKVFGVFCAGISESNQQEQTGIVLSYSVNGAPGPSMEEYELADTPCEVVMRDGICVIRDQAFEQYPGDEWLKRNGLVSFVGIRLEDRILGTVGGIWIADTKPMEAGGLEVEALSMIAPTVAAELAVQVALDRAEED